MGTVYSAQGAETWRQGAPDGFAAGTFAGTEVDSLGRVSLASFRGANLALGVTAVSGENTLRGSRSVTDGSVDTEWRFNNQAEVLGEFIRLDLGGDRGVSRIRIEPGKTIEQRPQFFIKGYRVDVAREADPDEWILVAQEPENVKPTVDTAADSTWIDVDDDGNPLPVLGRFVRLRITRDDPPNWVSIGEVAVFGEGFRSEGSFESEVYDAGQGVNFGAVRFEGEEPAHTRLRLQLRASADNVDWTDWLRVPEWSPEDAAGDALLELADAEPARFLQYRVSMETGAPLSTPVLGSVEVDFDRALYASAVSGSIAPLRPVLAAETLFTYVLEAVVDADDRGFDTLRIGFPGEVEDVRVDGVSVPEDGYAAEWNAQRLLVQLTPEYRVRASGRVEVDFHGVLLRPTLAARAAVALSAAGAIPNFQNAREDESGWTLIGRGLASEVLPRDAVRIRPNPFNAAKGSAEVRVDLAKVQLAQEMTVRVYELSGRLVRTLWDRPVTAGRHRLEWDGRDDGGRMVPPGMYLLRVAVAADVGDTWLGVVGVVY